MSFTIVSSWTGRSFHSRDSALQVDYSVLVDIAAVPLMTLYILSVYLMIREDNVVLWSQESSTKIHEGILRVGICIQIERSSLSCTTLQRSRDLAYSQGNQHQKGRELLKFWNLMSNFLSIVYAKFPAIQVQ